MENITFQDVLDQIGFIAAPKTNDDTEISQPLGANVNIVRNITDNISIRNGKYGAYIFYKTAKMKKPSFHKLDGFKENYTTCPIESLKTWIKTTYQIPV